MGVMTPEAKSGRGLRYQLDTGLGHLTIDERAARGKAARTEVPRESHAISTRRPTGPTRSACWRSSRLAGCPSWCRCATAG